MATPTNHWKLGLFVVTGFVLALITVVVLGAQSLKKQTVSYKTYFDESVQGLAKQTGNELVEHGERDGAFYFLLKRR